MSLAASRAGAPSERWSAVPWCLSLQSFTCVARRRTDASNETNSCSSRSRSSSSHRSLLSAAAPARAVTWPIEPPLGASSIRFVLPWICRTTCRRASYNQKSIQQIGNPHKLNGASPPKIEGLQVHSITRRQDVAELVARLVVQQIYDKSKRVEFGDESLCIEVARADERQSDARKLFADTIVSRR